MNELVYLKNNEAVCDSLQVAEKFGKRHGNVMRTIESLKKGMLKIEETPPKCSGNHFTSKSRTVSDIQNTL